MTERDIYQLFDAALGVTNKALEENRDSKILGTLISAADKVLESHKAGVEIYDEDPSKPFDYFTIRYLNGKLEIVSRGKSEHDTEWKVSREYLQDVADNPQKYIDNPAKLNLDWLKARIPDGARAMSEGKD